MNNSEPCLILTATIDPKGMTLLVRSKIEDRLNDYKKSFTKWLANPYVKKLIFVENSGYDLSFFEELKKNYKSKDIEIISCKTNNDYPRHLGKGYGESLCLKEIVEKSNLFKNSKNFIAVTGRHYVKNYEDFIKEFKKSEKDIFLNLRDNLKFADTNCYGGSSKFLINYLLPETQKVNDSKGRYFEHCAANAVLKAIADGYTFEQQSIYVDIEGYIASNGKKYKTNFFKKIRLFFYGKIKKYFFKNFKY